MIMPKKETYNVKKVPKTGAERIREYRARIIAHEKAAAARAAANIEVGRNQTATQAKLKDNQVDISDNQCSQLSEAFKGQSIQYQGSRGNGRQSLVPVNAHQQDLSLQSEVSSTTETKPTRHSKTPKTPAERARAYRMRQRALKGPKQKKAKTGAERARAFRRRRKVLKNAANKQLIIDTTDSQVGTSTADSHNCKWTSGSSNLVCSSFIKVEPYSEDNDNKEITQTTKRRKTQNLRSTSDPNNEDECSLYTQLLCKKLQTLKETTRETTMLEMDRYIYSLKQQEKSNLSLVTPALMAPLVGQFSPKYRLPPNSEYSSASPI